MIRVVSENTDAEIARNRAREAVGWQLRELTANLLRVTRGAGRAHEIGRQASGLVEAMVHYHDVAGVWPSNDELAAMLRLDETPDWLDRISERHVDEHYAKVTVVKGALQIAASQLVGQRTQERRGESEIYDGINQLEVLRARERAEYAAQQKAATLPQRSKQALKAAKARKAARSPKKPASDG